MNLKGTYNCIRHVARIMMKQQPGINRQHVQRGRIIAGNIGQVNYAASKGGVIGLTQSQRQGARVTRHPRQRVAPGFIATAMTDKLADEC